MAKKKKKKQAPEQISPEKYIRTKARSLPIYECLIQKDWLQHGLAHVIVTRVHASGNFTYAIYLVDTYCLGVKDSFYRFNDSPNDYEGMKAKMSEGGDFVSIPYEEAHNMVYGAVGYARELGIQPDKYFAVSQYLLEEDTDDVPLIEYEFGKDGMPFLITQTQAEANHYLPILRKTVGEGNFHFLIDTGDDTDDKYDDFEYADDDDEYDDDDDDDEEEEDKEKEISKLMKSLTPEERDALLEAFNQLVKVQEEDEALTHTTYSYVHPEYPDVLRLAHPELSALSLHENADGLDRQTIDMLLKLPRESLIDDLMQLIYYETGQTCDHIPDELWKKEVEESTLIHALFILGELKAERSLPAVLEIMRQNNNFKEFHFGDFAGNVLPLTFYYIGRNQLPALLDYMKEPGLNPYFKFHVATAVSIIATHEPERREEVVGWFRELFRFYIENALNPSLYDASLADLILSDLIDIKAKELLPEIKQLSDTGQLSSLICGKYEDVEEEILYDRKPLHTYPLKDIYERYAEYGGTEK